MTSEVAISVENLTKDFQNVRALDSINLEVNAHQVFGLIGPDGAGKTTLMRTLATLHEPTEGKTSVFGHNVVGDPWSIKSRIGYMPQSFSLYRDLSVAENIAFYAGIYHVPKKRMGERSAWLLDFTGLASFTERIADALSGGMKQKLALACALIHEPELLLLDEPTTGVDPISRRDFWRNIETLSSRGMTVFVSTPYMDEAERCHRIAFIDRGKIVREGDVEGIKSSVDWKQFAVRGPALRELNRRIKEMPGVSGAQLVGTVVRVQGVADMTSDRLRAMLPEPGSYTVEEVPTTLEDVFAGMLGSEHRKEPAP